MTNTASESGAELMPIRIFGCSSGDMIAERFVIPQYRLGECWMSGELFGDPILRCIRAALLAIYGNRIERLVLFGSRARGDAHADSD